MLEELNLASFILAKVKTSKEGRPAGGSNIKGVAKVEVAYDLNIGQDYSQRVSQAIPWQRIACLALAKSNDAHLAHTLRTALDPDVDTDEYTQRITGVLEALLDTSEKTVKGKVTGTSKVLSATFV